MVSIQLTDVDVMALSYLTSPGLLWHTQDLPYTLEMLLAPLAMSSTKKLI